MQIANPLYDTVFKYLLDDEPVARLFLSELLGREIVELTYDVQELLVPKNEPHTDTDDHTKPLIRVPFFSVLRLDFGAKLRLAHPDPLHEYEKVLIEVQKSNNINDVMRFRRYLGMQYSSKHNATTDDDGNAVPISIYPIYFLGEGLPDLKGHGVAEVLRIWNEPLP